MVKYRAIVKGTVQGVGFRPFVYRTAKGLNLKGYVRNVSNSVEILLIGGERETKIFLDNLKNTHPPLAEVSEIDVKSIETQENYKDFLVLDSVVEGESDSVIPPDVSLCDNCAREIFDSRDKRYLYPFTVCTDCGPRFTIIYALPYDRDKTTMKEFEMCRACEEEYRNPIDRRFRAEPICCPKCGPTYELFNREGKIDTTNPIQKAAEMLDRGEIVAIKGVGGTHLASKVIEDAPVLKIRKILGRKEKPFAIMARDIPTIRKIAYISKKEERLLNSFRRPIVVLKKRRSTNLSGFISPGLHNIGVMLPYSGIHYLLFRYSKEPAFVMTSANLPGEPMAKCRDEILALKSDFSLIHNRKIKNRCDDSVIKVVDGEKTFLRRSRGYVPQPVELCIKNDKNILALGAELDVTACILKGDRAFISQYIGDTTRIKTLEYLEKAVYNLIELTRVEKIHAVALDLHPGFNTVRLGQELGQGFNAEVIKCQHHHAHIASLLAENCEDRIVGIAVDGMGFGVGGGLWGGEVLISGFDNFERAGNLMPQIMPGGDLATRYPARMVAGILSTRYSQNELKDILTKNMSHGFRSREEINLVLRQIERRYNTPMTTSAGRVLDATAALLGACYERTYEGEPAIKLEALAARGEANVDIPLTIRRDKGRYILDTAEILDAALNAMGQFKNEDIAASVQKAISTGLAEIAIRAARKESTGLIGVSGGVAYNDAIVKDMRIRVEDSGLKFITQTKVPCGDGGISLGQGVIAAETIGR